MRQRGIIGFSGFSGDEEATVCPEGQYGVPPFCFEPSSWLPGGAESGEATYGQCPEGTIGIPPNCVAVPVIPPIPATQCPEGQVINPATGQCVVVPTLPTKPVQCPEGQLLDTRTGACVVVPQPPPAPAPATEKPSWWSQRSDAEKWLVVGVGVLGAVSLLALIKGAVNPGYAANCGEATPNRRRRGRGRSPKA